MRRALGKARFIEWLDVSNCFFFFSFGFGFFQFQLWAYGYRRRLCDLFLVITYELSPPFDGFRARYWKIPSEYLMIPGFVVGDGFVSFRIVFSILSVLRGFSKLLSKTFSSSYLYTITYYTIEKYLQNDTCYT